MNNDTVLQVKRRKLDESHSSAERTEIIKQQNTNTIPPEGTTNDLEELEYRNESKKRKRINDSSSLNYISTAENQTINDLSQSLQNLNVSKDISGQSSIQLDVSDLLSSTLKHSDGVQCIRFYWWDIVVHTGNPGIVYLFGKIYKKSSNNYIPCCLSVKNIPKRIYVLPKGTVNMQVKAHVEHEFRMLAAKKNIYNYQSKWVTKYYAFDRPNVPSKSEYLEVKYPAEYPTIDCSTSKTIEHIFGSKVNSLELLLLERNIMGPCWLEIKSPELLSSTVSWCQCEINCHDMENISVLKGSNKLTIPPMDVATINVKTIFNSQTRKMEVTAIGLCISHNYQIDKPVSSTMYHMNYCFITHPKDTPWPRNIRNELHDTDTTVTVCDTESDVLINFLDVFQRLDPDVLVGYDCDAKFNIIYHRCLTLQVKNFSKFGKLKETIPSKSLLIYGRPICDILTSIKDLNVKIRSHELDSICHEILKTPENTVNELKSAKCREFYRNISDIKILITSTIAEASYTFKVMHELNILPLALEITQITGYTLARTLAGNHIERIEYLLLHAFTNRGYITPDKNYRSYEKGITHEGGLVLEPQRGLYDKLILLMDFISLYPSIIQEYNLCFTTIPGVCNKDFNDLTIPRQNTESGVIPTEIRKLVERRQAAKRLLNRRDCSTEQKKQYDIRQLALKVTANSVYGCLGANYCRFYAKNLAALVTAKGREILLNTKKYVENQNLEVIYGDTDSIMINIGHLNYTEALSIGEKLIQQINNTYKKVKIKIDAIFRFLLLLQKKRYAALVMNKVDNDFQYNADYKGIGIIRKDYCTLASDIGKVILNFIFRNCPRDEKIENIKAELQRVAKCTPSDLPLSKFTINKKLTKNLNEYANKRTPHLSVASRLQIAGARDWKIGDTISYVICKDDKSSAIHERAYHIDEFTENKTLQIDYKYYLLNQVIPVIAEICAPLGVISNHFLTENLGIQDVYTSKSALSDAKMVLALDTDCQKSYVCKPFAFYCPKCFVKIEITQFYVDYDSDDVPALFKCSNPMCDYSPWRNCVNLCALLKSNIENFANNYSERHAKYNNDEDSLENSLQLSVDDLSLSSKNKNVSIESCDSRFAEQLRFYRRIFDTNVLSKIDKSTYPPRMLEVYDELKKIIEDYALKDSNSYVDFGALQLFLIEQESTDSKDREVKSINCACKPQIKSTVRRKSN